MTDEEFGKLVRQKLAAVTVEQTGSGKRVVFNDRSAYYAHQLLAIIQEADA